jgi:RNA polymerase sigma factor for flagellar operon FliA
MTAATVSATTRISARAEEELIRAHMPLVGHVVREMLVKVPAHVHRDDLTSAGLAALVTAARAFDAERGIPFARFAAVRVRGALLDELRGLDWASRSVRQRARRADTAREELTRALGRTPTAQELAELLGVGVSELNNVADDVQRAAVLSLQGFVAADDMITEASAGPEELLLHRERIGYLHDAIEALPEKLRYVVAATFLDELPLCDVAAELGVSESRVSQLRTEALGLLREGMNTHLNPELVGGARTDGCVARRRAAYAAQVAARGTLHSRLAMTNIHGVTVRPAA